MVNDLHMDILKLKHRTWNLPVAGVRAGRSVRLAALVILASSSSLARGQDATKPGEDFFESKIRPVLAAKCYACHSSKLKSPMSGLVLDTKAGLLKGGDFGQDVIPGKP